MFGPFSFQAIFTSHASEFYSDQTFLSSDFEVSISMLISHHRHMSTLKRERIADAFVTIEKLLIKCKYFPPLTSTHNFLVRILSRSLDDVRLATVKHYVQVNDAIGEYEHYMCNE